MQVLFTVDAENDSHSGEGRKRSFEQQGNNRTDGVGKPQRSNHDKSGGDGPSSFFGDRSKFDGELEETEVVVHGLRLLANRSDEDIADELDLLDMVGDAEREDIIRSYIATHIVPQVTGKTLNH
jgi:hypothetical protein